MKVHRKVCANSLKAVVVELPGAQTAAVWWKVRVGSRDELPRQNGISHFVEHLIFRGTERFPSEAALYARFASLGALTNATTSREATWYGLEVLPENVGAAIETLGEASSSTTLNGIEVERRIVALEVELYQVDGIVHSLADLMALGFWPVAPMGQPPIGSAVALRSIELADVRAFLARHYTADNSVVVVAGAVDPQAVLEQIERHFSRLARGPVPRRAAVPPVAPGKLLSIPVGGESTEALFGFALPVTDSQTFLAIELLAEILGGEGFARLHQTLRAKQGLAYTCAARLTLLSDVAIFLICVNLVSGKLPHATSLIVNHLRELRDKGPSAVELEQARQILRTEAAHFENQPREVCAKFSEAALNPFAMPVEDALAALLRLTCDDIQQVARRLFVANAGHLVARGHPSPNEYQLAWGQWLQLQR